MIGYCGTVKRFSKLSWYSLATSIPRKVQFEVIVTLFYNCNERTPACSSGSTYAKGSLDALYARSLHYSSRFLTVLHALDQYIKAIGSDLQE